MVDEHYYIVSYVEGDKVVSYLAYREDMVDENDKVSELYYDINDESIVYVKPQGEKPSEGIKVIELKAKRYKDARHAYRNQKNKQLQKKMNFR